MPECRTLRSVSTIEESHHTPKWLTKDFFMEKLRLYFKDSSLEVISLYSCPAVGKGQNFGSIMTRVLVQYKINGDQELKTRSYIVKSSFEGDDFANEVMKPYDIYTREMNIYGEIIPKLNALLEEIGDPDKMFPETVAVDYNLSAIIFEDLLERNFITSDKTKGLNMVQTKLCLKKLAKMHATSAVLNEREPGIFNGYDRGMFNRYTSTYSPLYIGTLEACVKTISQWDDYKEYAAKILALKPKLMEYGKQAFDVTDGHVNVFAHGDFWINNVMFHQENSEQQPNDAILIDFQFSCWGSPAIDLHWFFNTSLKEEIRLYHQDELFHYYYKIFVETLKALRFQAKIPSLHTFLIHMAEKNFLAFISGCLMHALVLNDQTEDADFRALVGEDERAMRFKYSIFQNEKVQKNLKRLLPMFDRKGLLDSRD